MGGKPKKKKVIWLIILFVVIIILVILFFQSNQSKDSTPKVNKNIPNEEQVGTLYRNNQYKFRIHFPEGWEIKDGDGPHIVKKATKEGSTVLVMVRDFFEGEEGRLLLNEMKQLYKEETGINISDDEAKQIMAELTGNDFSDIEFKEMMRGASEGILSRYENAKILDENIRYINNKKAFYIKTEISYRVLDLEGQGIMIDYITLYNGSLYVISGASRKEDFASVEKQINLSIASFVFEDF